MVLRSLRSGSAGRPTIPTWPGAIILTGTTTVANPADVEESADVPGAQQLGLLRKIFEARLEWWLLVPDQSLLKTGGKTDGKVLHLAARHKDGKWALIYLADKAKFSVDLGKLPGANFKATWINPADGKETRLDNISNQGVKEFITPDGWEDSLLLLEPLNGKEK